MPGLDWESLLDFANTLQVRLGASRPADMPFAAAKASAEKFSSFLASRLTES